MQIFRTYQVTAYVAGVWMLVSSATVTELYHERPANISHYKIGNENQLESLAANEQMERAEEDTRRRQLGETMEVENSKQVNVTCYEDKDVNWSDFFGLKQAGVKRWMSEFSNNGSLKVVPRNRSQSKWKINKGTSVVCYFKLCSFKQPT